MPDFRILHISDLHIAGDNMAMYYRFLDKKLSVFSLGRDEILRRVAQLIYEWRKEIDAVVITGDIAATGLESDLASAKRFLQSPQGPSSPPWINSKSQATIEFFGKPVVLVPGNHDRFRDLLGAPGTTFYRTFGEYWTEGVGGIQVHYLPNREKPELAIVCMDLTLDSVSHATVWFGGHWGQGRVYPERLKALKNVTSTIYGTYPTCAVMWILHHAPEFEKRYKLMKQKTLIDAIDLVGEAEQSRVTYILCGHTHKSRNYPVGKRGVVRVRCAGIAACEKEFYDTSIHVREVAVENGNIVRLNSLDMVWNPGSGQFLPG